MQWQEHFNNMEHKQVDLENNDFVKLALSYFIYVVRVDNLTNFEFLLDNNLSRHLGRIL